jgi:acetyltransferase-like isoleucine patch superfamily enzyme
LGAGCSSTSAAPFYDMGGVDIADLVMIGPNVNIITAGHALAASQRRAYVEGKPIVIERNVWIATGATILGGVIVGEKFSSRRRSSCYEGRSAEQLSCGRAR